MEYKIHIEVHAYAEGEFCDRILRPHSKNYGIVGKDIVVPLRKINGKDLSIKNISEQFTVKDLWDEIDAELFGKTLNPDIEKNCKYIERYLVFGNLRYKVEDINKPLIYYLNIMEASLEDWLIVQLLINANAGEIIRKDGIHYYINSKEAGEHHLPHIHVNVRHEVEGSFLIENGEKIAGGKFKGKDLRTIKNTIMANQKFLFQQWNLCSDGLEVDLDQAFGLRP